jgi:hypothetical protein
VTPSRDQDMPEVTGWRAQMKCLYTHHRRPNKHSFVGLHVRDAGVLLSRRVRPNNRLGSVQRHVIWAAPLDEFRATQKPASVTQSAYSFTLPLAM